MSRSVACLLWMVAFVFVLRPTPAAEPGNVRFLFAEKSVTPEADIPPQARHVGVASDADGKPEQRCGGDQGPLGKLVAGRIASVTVTFMDPLRFKSRQNSEDFLRRLLTTAAGATYARVPWAQPLGVPSIAAVVQHTQGQPGTWLIWQVDPAVYGVYQDQAGRWWFGVWEQADVWYFAYGSNLLQEQTQRLRVATCEPQLGRLADYRLAFHVRGGPGQIYADIVPQSGSEVWGVLYRCSPAAMDALDELEGVAVGMYHRQKVEVTGPKGQKYAAVAYVAGADYICPEGAPSEEYLGRILRGARQHGLPNAYLQALEELAKKRTKPR